MYNILTIMKKQFRLYSLFLAAIFACNIGSSQNPAFTASKLLPCLNEVVTLADTNNNLSNAWTWTISPLSFNFAGGTNEHSRNPKVQFAVPGNYSVNLSVTDSIGTKSTLKNNYIFAGGLLLPFTENWENTSTYSNWTIDNPDSNFTWTKYNVSGNGNGSNAFGVNNFNYINARISNQRDGLISPPINLSGYSTASLSFNYAYRRIDSTQEDSMAIYISLNCGASWARIASYRETQNSAPYSFITNANFNTAFAPFTFVDWCGNIGYASCKTIDLTPYTGSVIKIKFENISGNGNNLYLDDIGVTGVSNMTSPVTDFSLSDTTPCSRDTVSFTDLTTNSPTSWYWTFTPSTVTFTNGTNASSQNPKVLFTAGSYSVTLVTATANQSGSQSTKTFDVGQSVTPTISIICSNCGTQHLCPGDLATFNVSSYSNPGGLSFAYRVNDSIYSSGSSTFSTSTLKNHDTVICTLTSYYACANPYIIKSNQIVVRVDSVPPKPIITQNGDTLTCNLKNVRYQWYSWTGPNLYTYLPIQGATKQFYVLKANGQFKLSVDYYSACSTSSVIVINNLGLTNLSSIGHFKLYPNPSKDNVNLEFDLNGSQQITFTAYDIVGRKIFDETTEFPSGSNSHLLNFADLPIGIYYLQLKNSDGVSIMQRSVVIE